MKVILGIFCALVVLFAVLLATPAIAWSIRSPALTAKFMPLATKLMGRFSTPAISETNGARFAMGPPAAPEAIALMASV